MPLLRNKYAILTIDMIYCEPSAPVMLVGVRLIIGGNASSLIARSGFENSQDSSGVGLVGKCLYILRMSGVCADDIAVRDDV